MPNGTLQRKCKDTLFFAFGDKTTPPPPTYNDRLRRNGSPTKFITYTISNDCGRYPNKH